MTACLPCDHLPYLRDTQLNKAEQPNEWRQSIWRKDLGTSTAVTTLKSRQAGQVSLALGLLSTSIHWMRQPRTHPSSLRPNARAEMQRTWYRFEQALLQKDERLLTLSNGFSWRFKSCSSTKVALGEGAKLSQSNVLSRDRGQYLISQSWPLRLHRYIDLNSPLRSHHKQTTKISY